MGIILLPACSWLSPPRFPLLTANSEYRQLLAQQQWQIHFGDQDYHVSAVLQINDDATTLIFMDSLGQRMMTLTHTAAGLNIQKQRAHPISPLLPQLMEAVQFIYWPMADLYTHQQPDWTFEAEQGLRRVYFSGILAALVEYQTDNPLQGTVHYDNKKSDFHLIIKSSPLQSVLR